MPVSRAFATGDPDVVIHVPGYLGRSIVGELVDVAFSEGIAAVESLLEDVRQLVELSELPAGQLSVRSRANGGRVLVILLAGRKGQRKRVSDAIPLRENAVLSLTSKYRKKE